MALAFWEVLGRTTCDAEFCATVYGHCKEKVGRVAEVRDLASFLTGYGAEEAGKPLSLYEVMEINAVMLEDSGLPGNPRVGEDDGWIGLLHMELKKRFEDSPEILKMQEFHRWAGLLCCDTVFRQTIRGAFKHEDQALGKAAFTQACEVSHTGLNAATIDDIWNRLSRKDGVRRWEKTLDQASKVEENGWRLLQGPRGTSCSTASDINNNYVHYRQVDFDSNRDALRVLRASARGIVPNGSPQPLDDPERLQEAAALIRCLRDSDFPLEIFVPLGQ